MCQDFKLTGKCPRGTKCKLRHPISKKRRKVAEELIIINKKKSRSSEEMDSGNHERAHQVESGLSGISDGENDEGREEEDVEKHTDEVFSTLLSGSILPNFGMQPRVDEPAPHKDSSAESMKQPVMSAPQVESK